MGKDSTKNAFQGATDIFEEKVTWDSIDEFLEEYPDVETDFTATLAEAWQNKNDENGLYAAFHLSSEEAEAVKGKILPGTTHAVELSQNLREESLFLEMQMLGGQADISSEAIREEIIDLNKMAVQYNPWDAEAKRSLAMAYLAQGEGEKALEQFIHLACLAKENRDIEAVESREIAEFVLSQHVVDEVSFRILRESPQPVASSGTSNIIELHKK